MAFGLSFIIFTSLLCMQFISAITDVCDMRGRLDSGIKGGRLPGTIQDWLCIIAEGSRYDETAMNNGRYGLFEIETPYCKVGVQGGHCNIDCNELIDNNTEDDLDCANIMYNMDNQGFPGWGTYRDRCQGRDLSTYGAECVVPPVV